MIKWLDSWDRHSGGGRGSRYGNKSKYTKENGGLVDIAEGLPHWLSGGDAMTKLDGKCCNHNHCNDNCG